MADLVPDVIALTARVTDQSVDRLSASSRFDSIAGWSSYPALRLLAAVEETFTVRLDLRRYLAAATVAELTDLIAASRSAHTL